MDTGEGRFERLSDLQPETLKEARKRHPKSKGVFTVGEELEIRGSRFKVKDISPFGIKLKLLRQPEDSADIYCSCLNNGTGKWVDPNCPICRK